jgi:hypothetical protein
MVPQRPHPLRKLLRVLLAVPAALLLLVEEWIWDNFVRFTAWVARLPVFRRLEAMVQRLPPWAAVTAFAAPFLVLLPIKVAALWLMGTGRFRTGIAVYVAGKVVGTAVLTRLFTLTKPALLRIGWFARLYAWFTAVRDRLYAYVRSLRAFVAAKAFLRAMRDRLRAAWRALRGR